LDLNLLQREVADRLGVTESTITNWVGQRLTAARIARGLSREAAARWMGVDAGTAVEVGDRATKAPGRFSGAN